jgi:alkaline phosphatase D
MLNCSSHSFRPLDRSSKGTPRLAGESSLELYTTANLYFPYAEITRNISKHRPDLYVAFGDQFYEDRPTVEDHDSAPTLDFLYRYYLWLWSFRELTRSRPTVVLVDDHDVFQGNLWGHEGAPAPGGDPLQGGYSRAATWVNLVQRCQCGHNPDPYDPTPVLRGISVYYAAFRYGGISFAILEDRKWKTGDKDGLDATGAPYPVATAQLLGTRQQAFLRDWAARDPALPRICLTQTLFGCLQTDTRGLPMIDYDSNGYPAARRNTAVTLLEQARALILSGDQHLASVVRHGTTAFGDGPVQFVAPALGTAWQRWFEAGPLPNSAGTPHTGDWVDPFGNRMTVEAVANPKVRFADYRAGYPGGGQGLGDRNLKSEGYGIVRVDRTGARYVLECWPWRADPAAGGTQFSGWPRALPFSQT